MERAARLHEQGALTDAEYIELKQRILNGSQPQPTLAPPAIPRPPTNPAKSSMGSVPVPPGYIYDPNCEHTPNCQKARHDYCTNSPDQFPAPGTNADFSGACARHDMCYDEADRNHTGYGTCNDRLADDMRQVCADVYPHWYDPRRSSCDATAAVYWAAVTGAHIGKN
ncbi:phospholipase A2 [Nocardia terpenica]|uniref:Uncharacterized protein n=1 Tax=Nocardia terpenica TaxID=455432 RepID=A0A164IQ55_9NOCA|nr:phospholipase A2 [Nocardia terpenica]KZM69651.1 hypothetical protein AWN90_07700 [Nocardia terpenica]NQE89328.1 hypothetical protein [Nocardia terpenica]